MKFKQLLAAALLFCTAGAWAQTDVTNTYITNADFSQGPVITADIRGYGKDMVDGDVYGFQDVTGWSKIITNADNSNATYPNSAMGGAVLAYGSTNQLKGNNVTAPAAGPDGGTGQGLGFFGVWGCGGYYYQDVTFPAGKFKLTFPIYCISGTQANTTYTGFFPTSGTNRTVAINTTVGSWVNQTVEFTLTAETAGQIRIGYQSTGSGSGANPHLVFDGVKIEFTAQVVKTVLETAITAATTANASLNSSDLASAIATAQAVYNDESATQEQVNAAAATLNAAVELAMSAAGDVNFLVPNLGFESCTVSSDNAAAGGNAAPRAIDGDWTQVSSAAWSSSAVVEYGGAGQVNGVSAPATDNLGNGGYTLGVSVGWGGVVTYKTAGIKFPAGVYTFKVNAYNNLSGVTQFKSLFGFVPTEGTATLSTKTSFAYATWETDQVTVTLNEATEGCIQVGGQAISGGSGSNAKVFFDNITIGYKSFLAGAKAAYDEAVANAQAAKTECANVTGDELTTLNEELAKAEPTTVEGYNAAAEAINTATATLTAAKASYDAFVAAKTAETPELAYAAAAKKTALTEAKAATASTATEAATATAAITTALRAYYESHAKAEGVNDAEDYSSAVAAANADTNKGWTNGVGTNKGQSYTNSDGNSPEKYLDGGWAQSAACNIDMTRTVEIPAGKYLLTVKARGAVDLTEYTLSIAGETINLPHANGGSNGVFGNGWEDASIEFESDGKAQTLEIIAKSDLNQQWFSMNDFRLVQLELNEDAYAGTTEYTALNDAISAAEAKTLGFEDGQYAPYENVAALKALAAAKAIDQTAELTNFKEDVIAATEALTNATWTSNDGDVDAIFNGDFSSDIEGDWGLTGWTRTNAWGQQRTEVEGDYATAYYNQPGSLQYGNQGVYTMPLAANTAYQLTFSYRSHENNSNKGITVSVLNESSEGLKAVTFEGNGSTSEWAAARAYFTTGAAGNYVLTLANNGNTWMTGISLTKFGTSAELALTDTEGYVFNFDNTYMEKVKLTRKVVEGYNTVCMPFNLTAEQVKEAFGENAKVYTYQDVADGTNSTINFNTKEDNTIAANVPVLVGNATASNEEKTFNGVILKSYTGDSPMVAGTNFDFVGTYAASTDIAADDYFIGNGAIYKSTGATTIKAFRAYIKAKTSGAGVKMFVDGIETGIDEINGAAAENGAIYNLAGQRVNKAQKGVFIVNGKKVIVK